MYGVVSCRRACGTHQLRVNACLEKPLRVPGKGSAGASLCILRHNHSRSEDSEEAAHVEYQGFDRLPSSHKQNAGGEKTPSVVPRGSLPISQGAYTQASDHPPSPRTHEAAAAPRQERRKALTELWRQLGPRGSRSHFWNRAQEIQFSGQPPSLPSLGLFVMGSMKPRAPDLTMFQRRRGLSHGTFQELHGCLLATSTQKCCVSETRHLHVPLSEGHHSFVSQAVTIRPSPILPPPCCKGHGENQMPGGLVLGV